MAVPRPSPGVRQPVTQLWIQRKTCPRADKGNSFSLAGSQEPSMEGLTRLVTESLARHGFDRPLDYRRLKWSRWFRCESPRSLLFVPSQPGVFALAEEIINIGPRLMWGAHSSRQRSEHFCPRSRKPEAGSRRCRSPHAGGVSILRRRRHGFRSRPHALAAESPAKPVWPPDAISSVSS